MFSSKNPKGKLQQAVFVDFKEDYNTLDFYIFHQAEQDRIFSRQKLVKTQELSHYVPVFH